MEIYAILRRENHRDRESEVMGAFLTEEAAVARLIELEAADRALTTRRGYPNVTLNHYSVSGPFVIGPSESETGED